jgi:hypothetical protein
VLATGVRADESIEVTERTRRDQLDDAADLDEPGGVLGFDKEQAHPWVALDVASLPALEGRVDPRTAAVEIHPDEA